MLPGIGLVQLINSTGPTSPAYLLHSSAMISSRTYESYDMRYHHTWDVSSGNDGVIQVHEPQPGEMQLAHPKPVELQVEQRDVIEKLVNAYFTDVAPMLPVVTREEFIASSPPQPILLYAMCLIAAARREVPQTTFDSIRYTVNGLIKQEDILSTASIVNLQALLILAMCGDCHSQFAPHALSSLWVRLGCAIRMVGHYLLRPPFCFSIIIDAALCCRLKTSVCIARKQSNRILSSDVVCGSSVSSLINGECSHYPASSSPSLMCYFTPQGGRYLRTSVHD